MAEDNHTNKIEIWPYDPNWPELFKEEAEKIKNALGENCIEVHHIGSTAVPELAARPIIDILPVVKDVEAVDKCNEEMQKLGYEAKGEYNIPFRRYFEKSAKPLSTTVQVYEEGNPEIEHHLRFVKRLKANSQERGIYRSLKKSVANSYPDDLESYYEEREHFVNNVVSKTIFDGLRLVIASTPKEVSLASLVSRKLSSQLNLEKKDFEGENNKHFILYEGVEVIGCANVHLGPDNAATIRMLVIEDEYIQKYYYGEQFMKLVEKWLKLQGYTNFQVETSPEKLEFYEIIGYGRRASSEEGEIAENKPNYIALSKVI